MDATPGAEAGTAREGALPRFDPNRGEAPPAAWPCKVCGTPAPLAFTRSVAEAQLIEAEAFPPDYVRPYYRCPACNLLFHVGFDVLPEDRQHLAQLPGVGDAVAAQLNRARRECTMVLSFMQLYAIPAKARVLVFGCGAGLSYNALVRAGLNVYATDLSLQFADLGDTFPPEAFDRAALPKMIRHFKLLENIAPASMALVTLTEVFEHFLDPVAEMRRIAGLLAPGGIAVGTTGWVDRVEGDVSQWWYLRCLSHATFLSSRAFMRICAEAGCLGTLYPSTPMLRGETDLSDTQCMFLMQKPL